MRGWLQTLVKDGDDVRSLVVAVTGDRCVVIVMVWVGLAWAMLRDWQRGVVVIPQAVLVAKCELRNKSVMEEVS